MLSVLLDSSNDQILSLSWAALDIRGPMRSPGTPYSFQGALPSSEILHCVTYVHPLGWKLGKKNRLQSTSLSGLIDRRRLASAPAPALRGSGSRPCPESRAGPSPARLAEIARRAGRLRAGGYSGAPPSPSSPWLPAEKRQGRMSVTKRVSRQLVSQTQSTHAALP